MSDCPMSRTPSARATLPASSRGEAAERSTRRASAAPGPAVSAALLAAVALWLVLALPALAGPVVSGIVVAGNDRSIEIDVAASGPLDYVLTESADPFTLTLLFADSTLGFPEERRVFTGDGLSEIQARTVAREGRTLARVVITFARTAEYTVARDGSHVRIRVEAAGPSTPVVIGAVPLASPPAPAPAAPAAGPRVEPAELRGARPEAGARAARVVLDIEGAPTFRTFTMTGPARVVLDLENTRVATATASGAVAGGGGLLRGVRISQRTKTEVRVVCDLSQPASFRVEAVPGGLVIHLGEGMR